MDQINGFLQSLVSSAAYELHFEPNKSPFVLSDSGVVELSQNPLSGASISQMIFPIIPADAKQLLPNRPEIEFDYSNPTGNFGFLVKKSPSGFHVIVKPLAASATPPPPAPSMMPEPYVAAANPEPAKPAPIYGGADLSAFEDPSLYASTPDPRVTTPAGDKPPVRAAATEYSFESSSMDASVNATVDGSSSYNAVAEGDLVPLDDFYFQSEAKSSSSDVGFDYVLSAEQEVAPLTGFEVAPVFQKKMDALFHRLSENGASDLHLSVSMPPMMRKDGRMMAMELDEPTLTTGHMKQLLASIMPEKNREEFDRRRDTDFAYEVSGLARFRANIFMDRKGMGAVFRIIPTKLLTASQLNIPKAVLELCNLSKGLVVVTGPTGSGKSTTLAAMMDYLNDNREDHVITIEDPIEFVHENKKCLVNQREVHNHTDSFKDALRAALREDPDVLLVGEMRDLETIAIAIETAETGHLVFGTLHTTTAASTVDRIIDQFPSDRQQQIRVMLSESLKGVIAQTLLPKVGGGRVAALEILIVTPAVSNLIREGKTFQIPSAMQTGRNLGMTMLNDSMVEFVKQGVVEPRDAYLKSVDKTGLEMLFQRNNIKM